MASDGQTTALHTSNRSLPDTLLEENSFTSEIGKFLSAAALILWFQGHVLCFPKTESPIPLMLFRANWYRS